MVDCYEILGLPRGLDRQVYLDKYSELKARYSEDMFLSGEAGNTAARKLTELETAWAQLVSELDRIKINSDFGSDYGQIDALIREGKYDQAQVTLDALMTRDAEWHYYQSVIFYMREWMGECRKHLLIAVQMQPDNAKYSDTLQKLDMKMANPNIPPEQFGMPPYYYEQPVRRDNTLANCCLAYCCADCCCTALSSCC